MVQFGAGLPGGVGGGGSGGRNQLFRTIRSSSRFNLRNALLLLVAFFVVRNFLKNDYRREEMQFLRDSGMTEEQIERHIPKTAAERKKYVEEKSNDLEQMKKDIAYLLKEVEELKKGQGSSKEEKPDAGRGETLKSMDTRHEEKRRKKEEQLLKDHPNFKPSKRLKDSLAELESEAKTE